ncbi:hypothetical protein GT348_04980 [Aristophania vespae]|uniref:Uncharacterized protein n=1 Tax=Aristophania vespae TaxID=2697033 RepID=A0A6P1NFL5_9PROT|nr:hypothetical protein [Aristophania vespae]QHI95697.1 hypothetical protein GT348_04980 [Aristophania vespae]
MLQTKKVTYLLDTAQRNSTQIQAYARYFRALWHVVPLALITGACLFIHDGQGLGWPFHLMAGCGVIMALIFALTFFGPYQKARRSIRPQQNLFNSMSRRILLMSVLGIIAASSSAIARFF